MTLKVNIIIKKLRLTRNINTKIYLEKINQSKSLLKNSLSFWYPTLNLTANGFPQYFESNNYNEANSISDTSSKQWSSSISAKIQWDLINPARIPEIASANRSMLHRPSIPGVQFAHAQLLDLQDRHSGASESIFNDPEMLEDYLV